jgi:hypothetical protein
MSARDQAETVQHVSGDGSFLQYQVNRSLPYLLDQV